MTKSNGRHQVTKLTAHLLAARRDIVWEMAERGFRHKPQAIADAICRNPRTRHLLEGAQNKAQACADDIRAMETEVRELQTAADQFGLPALGDYLHGLIRLRDHYWREFHSLPPAHPRRTAILDRLVAIEERIAALKGVEGSVPLLPGGMIEGQVLRTGPAASGLVDPLTFATHEDFCGLDLTDKPMEQLVMQQFLAPSSTFNELVDICGMRAGKGTIGSVAVWYKVYHLLELADPQRYYGLTPGQTIGTYNMAMSQDQAKVNVFKHCLDRINFGGRWFQELKKFCDDHLGSSWQQTLQMMLPKNIEMRCGHSRAKSLVGGTNICVVFDELSKFRTEAGEENAEEVYTKMKATTATFGEDALILTLSSPEWTGDYGYGTLLKMAKETDDMPLEDRCEGCRPLAERPEYQPSPRKSHPKMMAVHMPTWEANTSLTFEALYEQHNGAANPRAFWRDFGAQPAEVQEAYYPNPERWDNQVDKQKDKNGKPLLRHPYDAAGRLAEWFKPCCDSRRFVHVDLALSRDACGIGMAHKPVPGCPWFEKIDGEDNPHAKKVVLELCLQVKPMPPPGTQQAPEIDFDAVRQFIRDWQERGFPVKSGRVSYDGWQSVDSRQILRKEGFRSVEFSLDRNLEGHDTLQELINTDELAYYGHPVLIREAKQLQLKSGRKVDHPPKGSKDVMDAAAGCVYHALRFGGRVRFIGGNQR